jgi:hypothetical protein
VDDVASSSRECLNMIDRDWKALLSEAGVVSATEKVRQFIEASDKKKAATKKATADRIIAELTGRPVAAFDAGDGDVTPPRGGATPAGGGIPRRGPPEKERKHKNQRLWRELMEMVDATAAPTVSVTGPQQVHNGTFAATNGPSAILRAHSVVKVFDALMRRFIMEEDRPDQVNNRGISDDQFMKLFVHKAQSDNLTSSTNTTSGDAGWKLASSRDQMTWLSALAIDADDVEIACRFDDNRLARSVAGHLANVFKAVSVLKRATLVLEQKQQAAATVAGRNAKANDGAANNAGQNRGGQQRRKSKTMTAAEMKAAASAEAEAAKDKDKTISLLNQEVMRLLSELKKSQQQAGQSGPHHSMNSSMSASSKLPQPGKQSTTGKGAATLGAKIIVTEATVTVPPVEGGRGHATHSKSPMMSPRGNNNRNNSGLSSSKPPPASGNKSLTGSPLTSPLTSSIPVKASNEDSASLSESGAGSPDRLNNTIIGTLPPTGGDRDTFRALESYASPFTDSTADPAIERLTPRRTPRDSLDEPGDGPTRSPSTRPIDPNLATGHLRRSSNAGHVSSPMQRQILQPSIQSFSAAFEPLDQQQHKGGRQPTPVVRGRAPHDSAALATAHAATSAHAASNNPNHNPKGQLMPTVRPLSPQTAPSDNVSTAITGVPPVTGDHQARSGMPMHITALHPQANQQHQQQQPAHSGVRRQTFLEEFAPEAVAFRDQIRKVQRQQQQDHHQQQQQQPQQHLHARGAVAGPTNANVSTRPPTAGGGAEPSGSGFHGHMPLSASPMPQHSGNLAMALLQRPTSVSAPPATGQQLAAAALAMSAPLPPMLQARQDRKDALEAQLAEVRALQRMATANGGRRGGGGGANVTSGSRQQDPQSRATLAVVKPVSLQNRVTPPQPVAKPK